MSSLVAGLINQTIDYIYSVTRDRYGDTTDTQEYNDVPCRWQELTEQIVNVAGEQVVSTVQIWLLPDYSDIQSNWKVKKGSKYYYIASIDKKYDLGGNLDYIKLYLV